MTKYGEEGRGGKVERYPKTGIIYIRHKSLIDVYAGLASLSFSFPRWELNIFSEKSKASLA